MMTKIFNEIVQRLGKIDKKEFEKIYVEEYEPQFGEIISREKAVEMFCQVKQHQDEFFKMNQNKQYEYLLDILVEQLPA